MLVLGCDPSLNDYGWALMEYADDGVVTLIDSGRIRSSKKDFFTEKYSRIPIELDAILRKYPDIDYVGVEVPPPGASWYAGLYPLYVHTAHVLFNHRLPFCTFLPTQIKAAARDILGEDGKMFKSDMVVAAKSLFPDFKGKLNHNIADAVIVANYAHTFKKVLEAEGDDSGLTDREKEALTKVINKRNGKKELKGMFYKEGNTHYAFKDPKYDKYYHK